MAESFAARLLGFLLCDKGGTGAGVNAGDGDGAVAKGAAADAFVLVFPRCSDVHTFGMRRCIDVAFVDGWGGVMKAEKGVPPWRRIRARGAACVLERLASCEPWVDAGEVVAVLPRRLAIEAGGEWREEVREGAEFGVCEESHCR